MRGIACSATWIFTDAYVYRIISFPLGNATDAEKYVQNLQNLYCGAEQHTLIHDVRSGDASATKKRPTGTDAAFSTTSSSLEGTVLSSVPASASGVRSGAVSPALTALSATNLLSTGAPSIPTTTTAELAALAATSVSDNPLSLDAPSAIAAPGLAGQTLRNNQLNMLLLQQQMQQRQRNQQGIS